MAFSRVKGTADFYPEELGVREHVFARLRSAAQKYGFCEVDVPSLESFELLAAKQGEEIRQQIFTIEKKGDEQLALRAEFTPSFARAFIAKQRELAKPVKWFTIGKVWRYERPQAGRLREFFQFNAEMYGSDKPESDAEAINLAIDALCSLGLTKDDFFVRLNNRKLLQGLLADIIGDDKVEPALKIIDKKQKLGEKQFTEELATAFSSEQAEKIKQLLTMGIAELKDYNMCELAKEGYGELTRVLSFIRPGFVKFDISVARGLAYYTSTVFEIFDTDMKFRSLCGGGRYDKLISMYDGEKTPATGFGIGYSTVSLLLESKGLLPKADLAPDYYIAVLDDSVRDQAMALAMKLRERYRVEIDLMRRNLSNQLKYANSLKAKKLIVFGQDEASSGIVKVKDMESGKEEKVKVGEI
jgi:histidyl-tRNA synthetase